MVFADRLLNAIDKVQNPSVVGLDPRLPDLPSTIREEMEEKYGNTSEGAAAAFFAFNKEVMDALEGIIPAVKPQSAFYEQYGHHGIKAFEDTIAYAKKKKMMVIVDAKRGDIGSTSEAYANAFLGDVPLFTSFTPGYDCDAITINPFLGEDTLQPFFETSKVKRKGVFILVKTSNKGSADLQNLTLSNNQTLYSHLAAKVHRWAEKCMGTRGYSSIGAVVGATHPKEATLLRELMPNSIFLVPGYGAQGGNADDTLPCFNKDGYGAIVNSSRGIIYSWKEGESVPDTIQQAAQDMKEQLHRTLTKAGINPW